MEKGPVWRPVSAAAVMVCTLLSAVPAMAEDPVQTYVRVCGELRREVLRVDRAPHEPAALVVSMGRDPHVLTTTVREHVVWEPELGVVRGPAGTLSAAAGGDWDQAVLLQAVLSAAGYPTRLVVAQRDAAGRAAMAETFLQADASRTLGVGVGEPLEETVVSGLLGRYGVPVRNRTILMAEAAARWRRLLDDAYDTGERHADGIVARLERRQSGPRTSFDFAAWRSGLEAAAAEAVAVEARTPAGWVLLTPGPGADRVDWSQGRRVQEIPADRMAFVTLRLAMTVTGEGAPRGAVVVLEHREPLAELFGRPMRLEIAAGRGDDDDRPAGAWEADEWYARVKDFDRFQAVLQVGSQWYASQVFDRAGVVHEVGPGGQIESAQQLGGGMHGMFGGMFGGGSDEPAKPATQLETMTLAIEIERPGLPVVRQHRLLYGPLRPGVTLAFHADILALSGPISPASVAWLALDALTANAALFDQVARAAGAGEYPDDAPARMPTMLYDWNLARLGLADRQLVRDESLTLRTGPTVSMWTTQILLDDESRSASARTALDVVHDGLHLGPRTADAARAAARANVSLGVGSTAFESLLLRELTPPATFRTALAEAELFLPQDGPDGTPPALVQWGIAQNEAGRTVLLAGGPTPNSWWSIDPQTIATVGRGDAGEGQAAAENLKLSWAVHSQNLKNLKCFMQAIAGGSGAGWIFCMTGVDSVGGAMGAAGSVAKWTKVTGTAATMGGLFGHISDALTIIGFTHEQTKGGR